jgi:hypothetical protein
VILVESMKFVDLHDLFVLVALRTLAPLIQSADAHAKRRDFNRK